MQTRVVSLTGGGVSLHPRVRYFSTASGNIRGNGGSGGWAGPAALCRCSMLGSHGLACPTHAMTPRPQPFLPSPAAGQGVTLLPGTYTQPLSFTGLYNLTQWGLRVLVRTLQPFFAPCPLTSGAAAHSR